MNKETMYTVDQIAERLKIHQHTVRAYIHRGELKAAKIGKGYKVQSDDLEQFLKEKLKEEKIK